jgi:uncharacterized caspase-like protein
MSKRLCSFFITLIALVGGCGPNIKPGEHPMAQSAIFRNNAPPKTLAVIPTQVSQLSAYTGVDNTLTTYPTTKIHPEKSASGRPRYALVIGNSDYTALGTLPNPRNDASAVAVRLRQAGFTLLRPVRTNQDVQSDLGLEEMHKADVALKQASSGAEIVMLFYAGHGLQLDGLPYLVPTDLTQVDVQSLATPTGRKAIESRLFKLDDFIEGLDQQAELAVAVFDACREIPAFTTRSLFAGGVNYRGLAHPQTQGKHRILAFSAGFGELAVDGKGEHSPYTQAFLDEFDQGTKLTIMDFFLRVNARVAGVTKQTPEFLVEGSVPMDAYLISP